MDPRIEKLADMVVRYSCKIQPQEHVLIRYDGDETTPMVASLMQKIYAAGAYPYLKRTDRTLQRELILGAGDEQLDRMCRQELAQYEQMDCFLSIHANHNAYEFADIPAERMENYSKRYGMPTVLRRMQYERWAGFDYPTSSDAQAMGMSTESYMDFFFRVSTMDYEKMYRAAQPLAELMKRTDCVHILGEGTDLTFSIRGIGSKICAGDHNIPDGEVFTAPVRDSVFGTVTYTAPNMIDGVCHDHIQLTFEQGKIVRAQSSDTKRLNQKLDSDDGSRYIGEFALGFNPYITRPMKNTGLDEKIAGSFHFTPGMSFDYPGNGNQSSIHCDFVCIQTPEYGGGEIWFDDVLIRKDGRFVLPELENLNPENLKDKE